MAFSGGRRPGPAGARRGVRFRRRASAPGSQPGKLSYRHRRLAARRRRSAQRPDGAQPRRRRAHHQHLALARSRCAASRSLRTQIEDGAMARLAALAIGLDHPHILVLDALAAGGADDAQEHGPSEPCPRHQHQENQQLASANVKILSNLCPYVLAKIAPSHQQNQRFAIGQDRRYVKHGLAPRSAASPGPRRCKQQGAHDNK